MVYIVYATFDCEEGCQIIGAYSTETKAQEILSMLTKYGDKTLSFYVSSQNVI